jgi:ribosomal protein S27E
MTKEEYNYAVQQEIHKVLERLKIKECSNPQCRYENSSNNNYCVKCGRLLPRSRNMVVISSNEYEELKKKANMSVWEKLKDTFSK